MTSAEMIKIIGQLTHLLDRREKQLKRMIVDARYYLAKYLQWGKLAVEAAVRLDMADELLREWITEFGPCTCHPSYKDRGLTDPDCRYHEHDYLIEDTKSYLEGKS